MDLDHEELEATRKLNGVSKENSIEEDIERIDRKLDTTEDEEITINLLFKKVDILETAKEILQKQLENSISKDTIKEKIEELKETKR